MSSANIRRRTSFRQQTVEDEALSEVAKEAEERLAAKRAARAEAREIRIREIERQQLEEQEKERSKNNQDYKKDHSHAPSYRHFHRRDSNDTTEDIKRELTDLQEKYVKTMTRNAQLDNDKQTLNYRVALLADEVDDVNETCTELRRQLKDKTRDFDHKKKACDLLQATVKRLQEQLEQRDLLIEEHGLVFISDDVGSDDEEEEEEKKGKVNNDSPDRQQPKKCALVSKQAVEVLESFSGTLDQRLVRMSEEKAAMEKLIKRLKRELDEEREQRNVTGKLMSHSPTPIRSTNGGGGGGQADVRSEADSSAQAELTRQLNDYKFKLKRAQQDITTLEGNIVRLEGQVKRYKSAAESSERNEEELRNERRRIQKELRDLQNEKSELEVEKNHLLRRLEKTKASKSK